MNAPAAIWAAERLWGAGRVAPEHTPPFLDRILEPASDGPTLLFGAGLGAAGLALVAAGAAAVDAIEADSETAQLGRHRLAAAGGAAHLRLRDAAAFATPAADRYAAIYALRWPAPPGVWVPLAAPAARPHARMIIFALMDRGAGERRPADWRAALTASGFVVEEETDLTDVYRATVMAGLARRLAQIAQADGGRDKPAALAAAAEPWLRRAAAFDDGRLSARVMRAFRRD